MKDCAALGRSLPKRSGLSLLDDHLSRLNTDLRAHHREERAVDDEFLNADEDDFETDDCDDSDDLEEDSGEENLREDAEEEEKEVAEALPTDHVVHVYEYGKFKRTIERAFTAEDAEAFASDYNRTAKPFGRFALAAKEKARPKKSVPWPVFKGASK